ncbi:MAG TPA: FKBP-type peptidyl-prolyl cis-trans isomerase [Chryseolinea sp.]|nr:FKBP-type peptidyl-prolyl cis-trans isomerase [Chryseolinea sp.]HPH38341.1 FKBP-type peptidyl-prolyl cis-trans isomerase [Sediminibacterium sp.]HPM30440.1 FKBP-type peptidyl-prolyl cis-trans isomerase [Chryseolinea sp.]
MKGYIVLIIVCMGTSVFAQSKKELEAEVTSLKNQLYQLKNPKEIDLNDKHKKASYGLGVLVAMNLKSQGGDSLNVDAINAAMKDVFLGKTLKIEQQQCSMIVQEYMQAAAEKKIIEGKEKSSKFLAENKTKEGVKVTASGLQYKVITAGTGKAPASAEASVTVHYTGKLPDGTVFDSSLERGEPATFKLNEVVAGWTEALQLMHEGDKWILYIPSELGWGEQGGGDQIPPNSAVVFEVELIKVN